jgi:hypothetical protein
MKKRRFIVTVSILTLGALLLVRCWPTSKREPVSGHKAAAVAEIEQASRREAADRLAQMPPAPVRRAAGKFSAETIQQVEQKFRAMNAVQGLITQEKDRRVLAQQILAMPDGAALMREILLNPGFAKTVFGDFQAESRFYAITVLDEAARQGDLDMVVSTGAELANQLTAVSGEPDPGRAEDLMGVAAVIAETTGSQGLQDGGSAMLAKLGVTSATSKPVRVLYLRGLFQGVWRAEGIEKAQVVLDRLKTL